jgi:CRP/FNR family transcriptional regulator, cyclic AMP receptor protein
MHLPQPQGARDKLWYFRAAPLFAGAGEALLARLAAASTMRHVPAHRTVYRPGSPSSTVYLLKEGQVRLARLDASGNEATIAILGPLDLFGEQAVAGEEVREDTAQAMVPSLICDIPRGDFLAAINSSPALAVNVRRLFGLRVHRLESRLADLLFKGAEARLCTVLLQLATDRGQAVGDGAVDIPLMLTARELGYLAGLSRPTTSLLLSNLRREGLIEGSARRLRLKALPRLRERAEQ